MALVAAVITACTDLATSPEAEKGIGGSLNDAEIRIAINDLWFKADAEMFRKVNLQVEEGRVLLSGVVQKPDQRVEAVRLAWKPEGVREVINEIQVADRSGLDDQAMDAWITKQLQATLIFDKDIRSVNYSVVTVNRSVFLMGIAYDQAELNRVVGHAKDIDDVRRVVPYVQMRDDPARKS